MPELKRERVKCAKVTLKKYAKYDSRICNRGCKLVSFFEPVRKINNNIWTTKHAHRSSVAKCEEDSVKKIVYAIFFRIHGSVAQVSVWKNRSVIAKFYSSKESGQILP